MFDDSPQMEGMLKTIDPVTKILITHFSTDVLTIVLNYSIVEQES